MTTTKVHPQLTARFMVVTPALATEWLGKNRKNRNLRTKKAELKQKYNELEHSSEEKLEEVGQAFTESKGSFKESFSKLASVFS